jgi:GNAT superfamily N-acetyltransferase
VLDLARERVHAASAAWLWIPATAARIDTEEYLALRFPAWYEHPLQIVGFRPIRPLDETLDVLARPLSVLPDLDPPDDVEVRWAADFDTFVEAVHLNSDVFGGTKPDRAGLEPVWPDEDTKLRTGGGGAVVAYLHGRPVGTAGVTVAGPDARLWGGGVLPEARGRGVYRALLAARLEYAVERQCEIAIVKGRVDTSGPILRRAGFSAYGTERSYLLDLSTPS